MTNVSASLRVRLGTRKSRLARWQASRIATMIEQVTGARCEAVPIDTAGDRQRDRPIPDLGMKGVFTRDLEDALRHNEIDAAVHSLKDLPTDEVPGMTVGAICARSDPRDVMVTADGVGVDALRHGAIVGTSSARRAAQVQRLRPDLQIAPIRGNVETRVEKVYKGRYDGTVLAAAGMERLGLADRIAEYLPVSVVMPAPGQGALAVQCRSDNEHMLEMLRLIDDPDCQATTTAERTLLAVLHGGCSAPIAAYCEILDRSVTNTTTLLQLSGRVLTMDGTECIDVCVRGPFDDPGGLGRLAAHEAMSQGASDLLPRTA